MSPFIVINYLYVYISIVTSQCERNALSCSDILYTGTLWNYSVKGVFIGQYTGNTLQWFGCVQWPITSSTGCVPNEFTCTENTNSMTFGSSGGVLRALLGIDGNNDFPYQGSPGCCNLNNIRGTCNSPDTAASATALCNQLGYNAGSVIKVNENSCAEVHWDSTSSKWTQDDIGSSGYGRSYTCSDPCNPTLSPTPSPTNNPTPSPTNFPTPSPTKNPTPFPTQNPTPSPTTNPTPAPTNNPTKNPTPAPTNNPTTDPTPAPTGNPTKNPTKTPTTIPTISPTISTLNPSKTPSLIPTSNPSISPTKNPTPSPTLPEGAVESDDGNNDDQGEDSQGDNGDNNNQQKSINSFNSGNLLYIIIGTIGLLLLCCIIFAIFCYKKHKKQKLEGTNEMNIQMGEMATKITNTTNFTTGITRLGSVSPHSTNSVGFGMDTAGGDVDEGGIIAMDTNSIIDDSDDENNDLFDITGANNVNDVNVTRGGGDDYNEVQLPELPNNNECNDEIDEDNALYNKPIGHVTTGGFYDNALDNKPDILNATKLCDQCGKSVGEKDGKLDENDGNWY